MSVGTTRKRPASQPDTLRAKDDAHKLHASKLVRVSTFSFRRLIWSEFFRQKKTPVTLGTDKEEVALVSRLRYTDKISWAVCVMIYLAFGYVFGILYPNYVLSDYNSTSI